MAITLKDIEDAITGAAKPGVLSTLESAIKAGYEANQLLETEGKKQKKYQEYFKEKGITNIVGFYDIKDDNQDAEVNAILSKYGSPTRNRKLMVLNDGTAREFYDRTPGQEVNYSGKEPTEAKLSGKRLSYKVRDPDALDLEFPDLSKMGLAEDGGQGSGVIQSIVDAIQNSEGEQPAPKKVEHLGTKQPSGYDVMKEWFSRNIVEPVMTSEGEQPPVPEVNLPGTQLPSGYEVLRDVVSRNVIEPLLAPEQPQIPNLGDLSSLPLTPVNGAQEPAVPPPEGLAGPVPSIGEIPQVPLLQPIDLGEPPPPPRPGEYLTRAQATSDLQANIATPTEAGSQQLQDYLALTRDLGIVPTFGNRGNTQAALANELQVQNSGGAPRGTGLVAPTPTGDAFFDWQEGTRYLGGLYGEMSQIESKIAGDLSNELDQLVQRRGNLQRLAADPRSGLDPRMLQQAGQGVDQQLEVLSKTAKDRATAALGGIKEQIAREEGRLQALKPEADRAFRERASLGDNTQDVYSATAAMFPTGEGGKKVFEDLSIGYKQAIRDQVVEWNTTPFSSQIKTTPEQQRQNDEAYVRYQQQKTGGNVIEDAFKGVSNMKQAAIQEVISNPDVATQLKTIQLKGATGLPEEQVESEQNQFITKEVMKLLDQKARDVQLSSVQTNAQVQSWMIDPTVPETQAVVEALPQGDGSLSEDQFVEELWKVTEGAVGAGRAEEVVHRMLEQYNKQWNTYYQNTGISSYSNTWFSAWKTMREMKRIAEDREERTLVQPGRQFQAQLSGMLEEGGGPQ